MTGEVTIEQFQRWLLLYADRVDENEPYLTDLDAAIGDADHGVNMQRGMDAVRERLGPGAETPTTVTDLMRAVGMVLISSIGGAAGPLYGAFFLRSAQQGSQAAYVDAAELARMFRSGLEGVKRRGQAKVSDKTMIDTLEPAVEAFEQAIATGANVAAAWDQARQAAESGMNSTINLQALKGRASYLGPRSVGHQDPGATSAYFLIQAAAETLGSSPISDPLADTGEAG